MGNNIDLIWLLGLPEHIRCSKCKEMTPTFFDEYDIDCGEPNVKDETNKMCLDVDCVHCEYENKVYVTISNIEVQKN